MELFKTLSQAISIIASKNDGMKVGTGANIKHHRLETMEGDYTTIGDYEGKVLMLVNVASKCGYTTQYGQLVVLQDEYKDRGFAVIGLPANDFMNQEPGSDEEIRNFCSTEYGVNFDVHSKISVASEDQHPLYKTLTSKDENGDLGGDIEWNFTKFVVDKHGTVVARIHPKTKPDDPAVIRLIDELLAKA